MRVLLAVAATGCLALANLGGTARVAAAQSTTRATAQAVARAIQPLLDDQLAAANAHDTDRFLRAYLHDSTLVFVFNGVITTGFVNVRAAQLKAWNNGKSDVVYAYNGPANFMVLTADVAAVTESLT
ncbi:MAG: hypothetical protein ACREJX_19135, partial [Polyangiaceae bacterium]